MLSFTKLSLDACLPCDQHNNTYDLRAARLECEYDGVWLIETDIALSTSYAVSFHLRYGGVKGASMIPLVLPSATQHTLTFRMRSTTELTLVVVNSVIVPYIKIHHPHAVEESCEDDGEVEKYITDW